MPLTAGLPIGIDAGSDRVCVAVARRERSGAVRIDRVASRPLAQTSEDATLDATAGAIREAMAEAGYRARRCVIGVPARETVVQRVRLPNMSASERQRAIYFEAQRFVPWDTQTQPTALRWTTLDGGGSFVVVAALRATIRRRIELARRAKVRPLAIDFEPFAAQRGFARLDAVLDVGRSDARLYYRGRSRFSIAVVDGGGESFTAAIQSELGLDRADAERRKRTIGMGGAGDGALRRCVADIVASLEVTRETAPVKRLALIGNGWRISGFAERLQKAANVEIDYTNDWSGEGADVQEALGLPDWALAASLAQWNVACE